MVIDIVKEEQRVFIESILSSIRSREDIEELMDYAYSLEGLEEGKNDDIGAELRPLFNILYGVREI